MDYKIVKAPWIALECCIDTDIICYIYIYIWGLTWTGAVNNLTRCLHHVLEDISISLDVANALIFQISNLKFQNVCNKYPWDRIDS